LSIYFCQNQQSYSINIIYPSAGTDYAKIERLIPLTMNVNEKQYRCQHAVYQQQHKQNIKYLCQAFADLCLITHIQVK